MPLPDGNAESVGAMELRHLRYFLAVAEKLNFSRVAEKLSVTQPALSRQIRDLEQDLGVVLFDRHGRAISLSSAGRALLPVARTALADADRVKRLARAIADGVGGTLRVGCSPQNLAALGIQVIAEFRARHPEVEIVLDEGGALSLEEHVAGGSLDIAIVNITRTPPNLCAKRLLEVQILAVCSPDHPLAALAEVDVRKLASWPLLLLNSSFRARALFDAACRLSEVAPRLAFEGNVHGTLVSMAEAGLGVAVVPATAVARAEHIRAVPVVRGRETLRTWLALVWRHHHTVMPAEQAFMRACIRQAGKLRRVLEKKSSTGERP